MPLDYVDIPITIALARGLGLPLPPGGSDGVAADEGGFTRDDFIGAAEVGVLTLQRGEMFFNGQPIGQSALSRLYALCRTPG
jgi:hypothetical protein